MRQDEVNKWNGWQTATTSPRSLQQRYEAHSGSWSNEITETIAADVRAFSVVENVYKCLTCHTLLLPAHIHPDSYTCLTQQNKRTMTWYLDVIVLALTTDWPSRASERYLTVHLITEDWKTKTGWFYANALLQATLFCLRHCCVTYFNHMLRMQCLFKLYLNDYSICYVL